jgi:5'-nucleotidase
MNILITNDDGWGFEGIKRLESVAREMGNVWVVAPQKPMSGISHQVTFEVPMSFEEKAPQSYALDGTPADCVRVGMTQLGVKFDWIFSGINKGANLGSDLSVSGTVAAAREASFFKVKAIAISQHLKKFDQPFDWSKPERLAKRVLPQIVERSCAPRQWFNINLPDVDEAASLDQLEVVDTDQDLEPLPADYKKTEDNKLLYCSVYNDRKRTPSHDVAECFAQKITVTTHIGP